MPYSMTQLTDAEKDAFIKDNFWGVLSFAGEEPYAIPVGYQYIKGDILLGFGPTGRKQGYVEKSRKYGASSGCNDDRVITAAIAGQMMTLLTKSYHQKRGDKPRVKGFKNWERHLAAQRQRRAFGD